MNSKITEDTKTTGAKSEDHKTEMCTMCSHDHEGKDACATCGCMGAKKS